MRMQGSRVFHFCSTGGRGSPGEVDGNSSYGGGEGGDAGAFWHAMGAEHAWEGDEELQSRRR
jgi:hypothetical protein